MTDTCSDTFSLTDRLDFSSFPTETNGSKVPSKPLIAVKILIQKRLGLSLISIVLFNEYTCKKGTHEWHGYSVALNPTK